MISLTVLEKRCYHPELMLSRPTLDAFAFARRGGRHAGTLEGGEATADPDGTPGSDSLGADALARAGALGARFGAIDYSVDGLLTDRDKPGLRVRASGQAVMQCQRCLEPVTIPVAVDVVLELAATQSAVDSATDDVDRVVASSTLDVVTLVEDELILGLPMVARHLDENCRRVMQGASTSRSD